MFDFKNNNKIIFIPGWLDSGQRHGFCRSLELWGGLVNFNQDLKTDYVIAHSLGALAALSNWQKYRNLRIILINPVISRKGIIKRWLRFNKYEGVPQSLRAGIRLLPLLLSFITIIKLFRVPALAIIKQMAPAQLFILRGEKDIYLADREFMMTLKERGFTVEQIDGAGHNYSHDFEKKIKEYIHLD